MIYEYYCAYLLYYGKRFACKSGDARFDEVLILIVVFLGQTKSLGLTGRVLNPQSRFGDTLHTI